jgi:hypothetical protein
MNASVQWAAAQHAIRMAVREERQQNHLGVDVEFVSQYRELVWLLLAPRSGAER